MWGGRSFHLSKVEEMKLQLLGTVHFTALLTALWSWGVFSVSSWVIYRFVHLVYYLT